MEVRSKAYHQPEYDLVAPNSIERVHEESMPNRYVKPRTSLPYWTYSSTQHNPRSSSSFRNAHNSSSCQYNRDPGKLQYNLTPANLRCYHCKGDHYLKNCDRFSGDKAKYKLKSVDMFKKCKDKIMWHAKKENMSINEAAFTMAQESTYSVEEAKQLLGNMHFSGSNSKSEWLDQHIREVTLDEVNLDI